jgi:hypothetical protein
MAKKSQFLSSMPFNGLPEGRYVVPLVRMNGHEVDIGQGQVIPNQFIEPPIITFDVATGILTIGGRSIDLGEQDRFYTDCKAVLIGSMTPLVTCSNLTEIIEASTANTIPSGLRLQTANNLFSGLNIKLNENSGSSGLYLSNSGLAVHALDTFNLIKQYTDVEYITGLQAVGLIESLVPSIVQSQVTDQLVAGNNITITPVGNQLVIASTSTATAVTSNTLNISGANLISSVNGVPGVLPISSLVAALPKRKWVDQSANRLSDVYYLNAKNTELDVLLIVNNLLLTVFTCGFRILQSGETIEIVTHLLAVGTGEIERIQLSIPPGCLYRFDTISDPFSPVWLELAEQ